MVKKAEGDKPHSTFTSETTPTEGRPGFEDTVVTTTTTTTDPIAIAEQLTGSFKENTDALRKVRGHVHTLRVLMVLVFLLIAGLGGTVYAVHRVQQSACRANNDLRAGLLHVADTLEEAQADEAFIADLRADFALREC